MAKGGVRLAVVLILLLTSSLVLTSIRVPLLARSAYGDLSNSTQNPGFVDELDEAETKGKSDSEVSKMSQSANHPPKADAGPDLVIKQADTTIAILDARNSLMLTATILIFIGNRYLRQNQKSQ